MVIEFIRTGTQDARPLLVAHQSLAGFARRGGGPCADADGNLSLTGQVSLQVQRALEVPGLVEAQGHRQVVHHKALAVRLDLEAPPS